MQFSKHHVLIVLRNVPKKQGKVEPMNVKLNLEGQITHSQHYEKENEYLSIS